MQLSADAVWQWHCGTWSMTINDAYKKHMWCVLPCDTGQVWHLSLCIIQDLRKALTAQQWSWSSLLQTLSLIFSHEHHFTFTNNTYEHHTIFGDPTVSCVRWTNLGLWMSNSVIAHISHPSSFTHRALFSNQDICLCSSQPSTVTTLNSNALKRASLFTSGQTCTAISSQHDNCNNMFPYGCYSWQVGWSLVSQLTEFQT